MESAASSNYSGNKDNQPLVLKRGQFPVPDRLLQMYRHRASLTQAELGQLIGISRRMILNWEAGFNLPRPEALKRVIGLYVVRGVFTKGKELEEARHLWEEVKNFYDRKTSSNSLYPLFDQNWFLETLEKKGTLSNFQPPLNSDQSLKRTGSPKIYPAPQTDSQAAPLTLPGLSGEEPIRVSSHNLPLHLSSFVGREKEVSEIKALLNGKRLVSLTGTGGVGKTRLALEVAVDLLDHFSHGVWLVDLAPLVDYKLVVQTIAAVFGVQEIANQSLLQSLSRYLRSKNLLLVLDNCEHVVTECALVVNNLLCHCPGLQILATSRQSLGIEGEVTFRVPSLSMPDPALYVQAEASPELSLEAFEAVRLFVERARLVQPAFSLTRQNSLAVAQLCYRLDGIPLALELAAVRMKILTAQQLSDRLHDRFRLLTGGSRLTLPRQQTLRALISWSYELLSETERALFRRLSVFAGGWTLESAEEVCAGDGIEAYEVLDLLEQLVNKSLVVVDEKPMANGEARYHFLETIRHYAQEELAHLAEAETVNNRLAWWGVKLAEISEEKLKTREQLEWLARLEAEYDNLRLILKWALQSGEAEIAGRIAGGIGQFWLIRGYLAEGRDWLEGVLATSGLAKPVRAKVVLKAYWIANYQGDYPQARLWRNEISALFREIGTRESEGHYLLTMADEAARQGQLAQAGEFSREAAKIFREINDKWTLAQAVAEQARYEQFLGNAETAKLLYEKSVSISREIGDRVFITLNLERSAQFSLYREDYISAVPYFEEALSIRQEWKHRRGVNLNLVGLGWAKLSQGEIAQAFRFCKESLKIACEVGERPGTVRAMAGLAGVAGQQGEVEKAVQLFAAVQALKEQHQFKWTSDEQNFYERRVKSWQKSLGRTSFSAAWNRGRELSFEEATSLAEQINLLPTSPALSKSTTHKAGATTPFNKLTAREVELLGLVAQGLTNAQIAEKLVISIRTVETHLTSIYDKLAVTSRSAATRYAVENQLI